MLEGLVGETRRVDGREMLGGWGEMLSEGVENAVRVGRKCWQGMSVMLAGQVREASRIIWGLVNAMF